MKNNKSIKLIKKFITALGFFILNYYLLFIWTLIIVEPILNQFSIWFTKKMIYTLLPNQATYQLFHHSIRIILSLIFTFLTLYFYNKSKNRRKFWHKFGIIYGLFVLVTLIIFFSIPWTQI